MHMHKLYTIRSAEFVKREMYVYLFGWGAECNLIKT